MDLEKVVKLAEYYRPSINWGIDPKIKTDSDYEFIDMLKCAILYKKNEEDKINDIIKGIKKK